MFLRVLMPLALLGLPLTVNAFQATPVVEKAPASVYMISYRTPAHIRYSKPEIFHGFSQDLLEFLIEERVPIKLDPDRGTIETESAMTLNSMLNIARQVGANSFLLVTIDRPLTKWIKVTVQSYELDGRLIWSEQASDGGGMKGKGGYDKTLVKIKEALKKRMGGPGLPIVTQPSEQAKDHSEVSEP